MKREIVHYPNKILKQPTSKVLKIDDCITKLILDMREITKNDAVLGVAANQVGESRSVLIALDIAYINPVIIDRSDKVEWIEGCLSFPGLEVKVRRFKHILVKYLTEDGKETQAELSDLDAIVVQHEIDHLLGLTFLDRIPPFKKKLIWKKYRKL